MHVAALTKRGELIPPRPTPSAHADEVLPHHDALPLVEVTLGMS